MPESDVGENGDEIESPASESAATENQSNEITPEGTSAASNEVATAEAATSDSNAHGDAAVSADEAIETPSPEPDAESAEPEPTPLSAEAAETAAEAPTAEPPVAESESESETAETAAEPASDSSESVSPEPEAAEPEPEPEAVEPEAVEPEAAEPEVAEPGAGESAPSEPAQTVATADDTVPAETPAPRVDDAAAAETPPAETPPAETPPAETPAAEAPKADALPPIPPHEPVVMQIVGGIVTSVSNKEVELTLDDGRAAVIHRENFDLAGTDPSTVLQVGDGSEGAVLSREDPKDRVVISRKWVLRDRAWKKAAECVEDHSTMHVKVASVSAKGAVVDVMGLRGFVPLSHLQVEKGAPSPELVGQMMELRVIAADRQKDKLLLSRRSQLLKEQRKAELEALQSLAVGSVHTGKVVDLTKFGAFVEVNGIRGLLHVSEMSWERVGSPKGLVTVGQELEVKVIELKVKKRRVSFSRKDLIEDPLASIETGAIYSGKVKRLVDYGVFVDIGPAEGMVHLSELAEYRPSHPSEIVLRGDEVQVKVLKVNRQKRRVELSMRQALYPS